MLKAEIAVNKKICLLKLNRMKKVHEMKKLKTVIVIALVTIIAGCATTNTGEKNLPNK